MKSFFARPLASILVVSMVAAPLRVLAQTAPDSSGSAPSSGASATPTGGAAGKKSDSSKKTGKSADDKKAAGKSDDKTAGAGDDTKAETTGSGAQGAGSAPTLAPPGGPSTRPSTSTAGSTGRVQLRKSVPQLPPPSANQLKALDMLQQEFEAYRNDAKDYRNTLTMIVRQHYDEKRQRVLSALDREISVEQKGLTEARDEAIRRLERFVELYSGANADPTATPDAMYRLAALYEERARADFEGDLSKTLKPAIALYRRIIREYPKYENVAGVYYFLGHAYTDSSRLAEGQQAWRSLVCINQYQVKDDPTDPDKIMLQHLAQDHDEKYWNDWYNRHPVPLDQVGAAMGKRAKVAPPPAKGKAAVGLKSDDDELRYKNPYPETCEGVPQTVEPGAEPKYVGEVWWQIGNYHFDQVDVSGGPYELNRAMTAYEHSMKYQKPPLYGVAMYKRAWTYFKQQRYKTAVQWFVNLLHYADEQQEKTGDPGADFRQEAYTYIAGSLTYVDFDGPPADHPNIPRNDVLDVETNPVVAEDKMKVAIDRVQDPQLIPQDKKWTVEIYKSLAQEFIEITQNRNAIAVLELTLKKFPMDRDAPKMQNKIAELYDQLARLAPDGSAVRAEYSGKALEARTKLAAYVGTTPWTDANRDDPEALSAAEELVRNGLQRAAADHTNYARQYFQQAKEKNDEGEQRSLIEKAIAEYRLAETGWAAYLEQDPTALDAYESRFWLADARYWVVVLQIALGRTPSADDVQRAHDACVDVRDSNEDDKYLQPAAYYLVNLSEKILEDKYRQFKASGGSQGLEQRTEIKFNGEGDNRTVIVDPVPPEVLDAIHARDDYNARIPLDRDPERNGLLYAFQSGDYYFLYGHLDDAKQRYQPIYEQNCGVNEWGYKAWSKLVDMANFQHDLTGLRKLTDAKSCATTEEAKLEEKNKKDPIHFGLAYIDAAKLFDEANKMPDGPERQKKWRAAAAAYKAALDAAPGRDEAPEAAMNGAYAYKQVGEYDKAIEMYELFISQYGSQQKLDALQKGDPKANPPVAADPKKYEQRVKFLKGAYDALASARVLFFNYPKAAETFDTISRNPNFEQKDQREAAHQALSLYSSLGDTGGMNRAKERFYSLGASPKDKAEADFIIASADVKKWDEFSPDTGTNSAARQRAEASMKAYYDHNKNNDQAAQYVVRAAYYVAKSKRASHAPSVNQAWEDVIKAFERYRAVAPKGKDGGNSAVGSAEAAMAAEGAFTLADQDIRSSFDYETGHHHYKGTAVDVIKNYQSDAVEAKKWYDKLQHIVDDYAAPEWAAAAVARQGSLYDSLRTGLYETRPPALIMFDKKTERLLKMAETSDNPDLQEKADAARTNVTNAWRDKREKELNSADEIMVDRYANSVMLARRYNVSNPSVVRAIQRLAFFTDVIGEAKLAQYGGRVKDLNYTPGMFLRIRPGLDAAPEANGMASPLPAATQ